MVDNWKTRNDCLDVSVSDGNSIANEADDLESLAASFDALVVVTSSFGDGEPPANFTLFLIRLLTATEHGGKPLRGLQHAVLGQGSSVYEATFQNCPRLTDKYLEALGSRRFVPRHETDAVGDDEVSSSRNAFREAVFECLDQGLPAASSPPAAEWSQPRAWHKEPTAQITPKTVAQLSGQNQDGSRLETVGHMVGPIVLVVFFACVAWHSYVHPIWY